MQTGKTLVEIDPKYFRPAEVEQLLGNPTKAKTLLGWNPRQTSFEELVKIMAAHDMKFVKKTKALTLLGIGANTPQPAGGRIGMEEGEPDTAGSLTMPWI